MASLRQLPTQPTAGSERAACEPLTSRDLSAALLESIHSLLRAATRDAAYRTPAAGMAACFPCEYVAIASRRNERFRLEVFTHLESFDRGSALVREWEEACSEYHEAFGAGATVQTLEIRTGEPVVFVPLVGGDGSVVAFALLKQVPGTRLSEWEDSLRLFGEQLGAALDTKLSALRRSHVADGWSKVRGALGRNKRRVYVALAAATVIGLLPFPYHVRCEAELQPVVRRHIAAPFDGILQRSLVKPGDIVTVGQPLGRLDPKELTWEIAAATAERDRAAKSRDVNMAAGKTAAAQIDLLESKRHDERRKLLENRLANLDVSAPIAGVVVTGDLQRAEGAPVKVGQSLFEVAPLDRMVVEVFVPEADIDRVQVGQKIYLYLDSAPGASTSGVVSRIYPRAELHDGTNVFVAEVLLENEAGLLRPGMKASVDISTERRPLAWIAVQRVGDFLWRRLH